MLISLNLYKYLITKRERGSSDSSSLPKNEKKTPVCIRYNVCGQTTAEREAQIWTPTTSASLRTEGNTQYTKRKTHNTTKPQPAGVPRIVLRVCVYAFFQRVWDAVYSVVEAKNRTGKGVDYKK